MISSSELRISMTPDSECGQPECRRPGRALCRAPGRPARPGAQPHYTRPDPGVIMNDNENHNNGHLVTDTRRIPVSRIKRKVKQYSELSPAGTRTQSGR